MKFFSDKVLISIEEYFNRVPEAREKYSYWNKHLSKNDRYEEVQKGMIKWSDNDYPEGWCGPFPGNYVLVTITVYNKDILRTKEEEWENTKRCSTYTKWGFHPQVLLKAGFDNEYWKRPFVDSNGVVHKDHICSYSEMTLEEYNKCVSLETFEERLYREIEYYKTLANRENNPNFSLVKENNIAIRFSGNDDCSYTLYTNEDINISDYSKPDIDLELKMFFRCTNWNGIKKHCVFTN